VNDLLSSDGLNRRKRFVNIFLFAATNDDVAPSTAKRWAMANPILFSKQ
jgi:hypothetical protein